MRVESSTCPSPRLHRVQNLDLDLAPLHANDQRLWALLAALRRNVEPLELTRRTAIDPWFIHKLASIVATERRLLSEPLTPELLLEAKRKGFSDGSIGTLADRLPEQVRGLRPRALLVRAGVPPTRSAWITSA